MEQAIIALISLSVAVTFYLDRGRRATLRQLKDKLDERFDKVDGRFEKLEQTVYGRFEKLEQTVYGRFEKLEQTVYGRFDKVDERFATVEQNLERKIRESAARTDARINDLNRSVIELAQSVGRAEGRTETLAAVE